MNPIRLDIYNLFSYYKCSIPFKDLSFTLFRGKTGSGKSSIFDIMCWVIYGRTARKSYRSVVRDIPKKQKLGYGKYYFNMDDGNRYCIKRITGQKRGLVLYENGIKCKLRTETMIQERIEKIVGMDFDTFLNVCYYSQGDIGKFFSTDSGGRTNIISKILNLIALDKARNDLKKKLRHFEYKISGSKGKLMAYSEMISEIDIKEINRNKKQIEAAINEQVKKLSIVSNDLVGIKEKIKLQNDLSIAMKRYNDEKEYVDQKLFEMQNEINDLNKNKKSSIKKLQNKINDLQFKLSSYDKLMNKINKIKSSLSKGQSIYDKCELRIEYLKKEIIELNKIISQQGQRCKYCLSVIKNTDHIKKHIYEKKITLHDEENKLHTTKNLLVNLDNDLITLEYKKNKYDKVNNQIIALNYKLDDMKKIPQLIADKKQDLIAYKNNVKVDINKYKKAMMKIKDDLSYYSGYDKNNLNQLQSEYDRLDNSLINLNKKFEKMLNKKRLFEKYNDKINIIRKKLKQYENRIVMMRWWYDAFYKIKMEMINAAIPFVEKHANENLSRLLSGKIIRYNIDTEKPTNKFSIQVIDYEHNRTRAFDGWSGGEKDEMSISQFLALNKLASIRSGKSVKFLILDEKFAQIDSENRSKVFQLLKEQYVGKKIFGISHINDDAAEFNQVITVKKINNISTLDYGYN